ncbi:MAG: nucleoside deaminase [Candidatus Dormibacterales bacterium]
MPAGPSFDDKLFGAAVTAAEESLKEGGIPIGAALAKGGQLIAVGHNERVQKGDPIAHGEIACLRNAGRQASYKGMTLYTTLSPCPMCSGAILLFGIERVVVGEATTFEGNLPFLESDGVEVVLRNDPRCVEMMNEFQRLHPDLWNEDIGVVGTTD